MQNFIYFYNHSNGPYKCFSQWFSSQLTIPKGIIKDLVNFNIEEDNLIVKNAEQWMMITKALLFGDNQSFKRLIAHRVDPKTAKEIGRNVKGFNEKIWDSNKLKFVVIGNIYKFNGDLYDTLQKTGNSILAEASPHDKVWGIGISVRDAEKGKPWNGQNLLGIALMIAREYLKKNRSGNIDFELLEKTMYFVLSGDKPENNKNNQKKKDDVKNEEDEEDFLMTNPNHIQREFESEEESEEELEEKPKKETKKKEKKSKGEKTKGEKTKGKKRN